MQTLLAVFFSYLSVISSLVDAAPVSVWHHINGEQAKCYPRVCQAGTQVQICESGDPAGLTCVPCPDGTFMDRDTNSTEGLLCIHRDPCSELSGKELVHLSEDPTADNVCHCLEDYQDMNYDPRSPSATGHTCRYCKGDNRYLDMYGDCVYCPFKVETDAYNHKTCPSDGVPIGGSTVEPGVTKSPKPAKNKKGLIIGLTIGVILIIVIVAIVLWRRGMFKRLSDYIRSQKKEGGVQKGNKADSEQSGQNSDNEELIPTNLPSPPPVTEKTPPQTIRSRTRDQLRAELCLTKSRAEIVKDLDVNSVLDSLISEGLLSGDEPEEIRNGGTFRKRAGLLLDIICRKPNGAVVLIDILKDDFEHLWTVITNTEVSQEDIDEYEKELANP